MESTSTNLLKIAVCIIFFYMSGIDYTLLAYTVEVLIIM